MLGAEVVARLDGMAAQEFLGRHALLTGGLQLKNPNRCRMLSMYHEAWLIPRAIIRRTRRLLLWMA